MSCLNGLIGTGEVKNYKSHMGIFEVTWDETFESFLTCSVPQLKTNDFSTRSNVLTDKVDSYCRLDTSIDTFLVGSNSFLMYLAMMELFPTF